MQSSKYITDEDLEFQFYNYYWNFFLSFLKELWTVFENTFQLETLCIKNIAFSKIRGIMLLHSVYYKEWKIIFTNCNNKIMGTQLF